MSKLDDLPALPWDTLDGFKRTASQHPDGLLDLSMGSPVDPTPQILRDALVAATDAPGYPQVAGTPALRDAIVQWYERRRGVADLDVAEVLPTIGSKELIAGLPTWLGLGPGDTVVHPSLAYPTYAVGAALAGADSVGADDPAAWPASTRLVWLNSPRNPDGKVWGIDELRGAVRRARELGAVIACDECYAELGWSTSSERTTPSILDPRVVGVTRHGVLSVYSLSKQSNIAGYRAGVIAGDADILRRLLTIRRHSGLITPNPVQAAMRAAFSDDRHVAAQVALYAHRRSRLIGGLAAAGLGVDESTAGLFLWATRREPALETAQWFAERGILVAPGSLYGPSGAEHVRLALTATDTHIDEAVERLAT
ncbi:MULTISPECIES: succinyldiaminopimelate transaminase [unclassified Curtobacterium]|uniref:succinyldiaminopimelate transaminase n=1 Tax=unclassified Curtobacterium TaxID=257496 RepID=UPI000DA967D4|nr:MULTISPECIES: succinyldiaminopimelate transaminase [unclassified Curtobacterium]PZE66178.1 succinyldiaminopimelate transaminase [Curtobacterium sp. MCLR17_059]PZF53966.1 succinyldiaminopimelate transaminase [Curtobacterium sp. MCLR17_057]